MTLFGLLSFSHSILALSPIFSRQEIRDASIIGVPNSATIKAVSYQSNGQVFDATIWFSARKNIPFVNGGSYGILIDADRNIDTGWNGVQALPFTTEDVSMSGADYLVLVASPNGKNWTRIMFELSSSANVTKVIDTKYNYPSPNRNIGGHYANLTFNLDKLYFPTHYTVKFFTGNGNVTKITDATDWLSVPSPIVQLTAFPNSISVEPGKNNTLQIQSKSDVDPQPKLVTCFNPSGGKALTFPIRPNQTIDSDQPITSVLTIHAAGNISEGSFLARLRH
jgi:hypothetical protein